MTRLDSSESREGKEGTSDGERNSGEGSHLELRADSPSKDEGPQPLTPVLAPEEYLGEKL